ncbi:hypothetical protein BCR35DRAFT_355672 [Leucosporidium creatinivorum]|uniref:GAF domain-like protein n=1 Tax=Leucosporidium creatinivorum TaxID=106004 RepID=A0A1Y2D9M2_9BASI|nr:hypothetical protein BCR35DRAFT_355672 [Leucosporidium creatinivorum]
MAWSDNSGQQEEKEAAASPTAPATPPVGSATAPPPPFERRPSITGSSSTRIYPIKSVAHPSMRARRNSAATSASGPLSPRPLSPVESVPSSVDVKPPSLDPFLPQPTTHEKVTQLEEEEGASSAGWSRQSDTQLFMSERFEHQEGEDGDHYIVTGRNGQIERCEDEPIHVPGAVQAYGVLIAFEREEDGRLIVRQASENTRHIIGLSPTALFRAASFADLLAAEELDSLLDAMDALDERETDQSNREQGPISFELSGVGSPGTDTSDLHSSAGLEWHCHAALHRPSPNRPQLHILELELVDDQINPLKTVSEDPQEERHGMNYDEVLEPSQEALRASTVSLIKPLRALARIRARRRRAGGTSRQPSETDFVALLSQASFSVNDQLARATDLKSFAKLTACVFAEISEASRCMVYQFDEQWNGKVLAEQVDYTQTHDLYLDLSFPASDIPPQARELYRINKVRLLYDRDQPTARMCCRDAAEVETPLDMTHSLLRAMSPIHVKYLSNMGVRSSMSISIVAFDRLWGLATLHTYGKFGHRVSFPVRQLCKLLGESIGRNIERISYATRINARKLIHTEPSVENPSGFIVAKSEDLLSLFDADFGVLSIGDEAKIMGEAHNSQDILALLEYLRTQDHTETITTQDISKDWPDLEFPSQSSSIAGALVVPLSSEGKDFIVFLRRGQEQERKWAGNPYSKGSTLEPRTSFKTFTEKVVGRSRAWTDEQVESSAVLLLVYSKFIAVWREKQSALAANQLNAILLSNASHEVRTPLHQILNYLELALEGDISPEAREHITRSHEASRSLVHVINDLLDLTRTEQGQDLYLQDPFNLPNTLEDALSVHRRESERQGIKLDIVETPLGTPRVLLGDRAKIRVMVLKLVENALKHTKEGGILIEWGETSLGADTAEGAVAKAEDIRVALTITDTGCGIPEEKLEAIFRQFEAIQQDGPEQDSAVGLGLATVARIVRMLGGQLRVDSNIDEEKGPTGTKVTLILPFRLAPSAPTSSAPLTGPPTAERRINSLARRSSTNSGGSGGSEIDSLIADMSSSLQGDPISPNSPSSTRQHLSLTSRSTGSRGSNSAGSLRRTGSLKSNSQISGAIRVQDSKMPLRASKLDPMEDDRSQTPKLGNSSGNPSTLPSAPGNEDVKIRDFQTEELQGKGEQEGQERRAEQEKRLNAEQEKAASGPFKALVVEDEPINSTLIERRLKKEGHEVTVVQHGGMAVRAMEEDPSFDIVLMDLNMPIMGGLEASSKIRQMEADFTFSSSSRPRTHILNGRVPILAVTANAHERGRSDLVDAGIDGWSLKPIRFARLFELMSGAVDVEQRRKDLYQPGEWERGGWLAEAPSAQDSAQR